MQIFFFYKHSVFDCSFFLQWPLSLIKTLITYIITRPGVARALQQTPPPLIKSVTDAFPPNLQNIITPKPLEQ